MSEVDVNLVEDLRALVASVKRLEDGLDALQELINESHQETLEKIDNLAEGGTGFQVYDS